MANKARRRRSLCYGTHGKWLRSRRLEGMNKDASYPIGDERPLECSGITSRRSLGYPMRVREPDHLNIGLEPTLSLPSRSH